MARKPKLSKEEEEILPRLYTKWTEEQMIVFLKEAIERHSPRTKKSTRCDWRDYEIGIRRWYILGLFNRGMSKIKTQQYLQSVLGISYDTAQKYTVDALRYLTEDGEEKIEDYRNSTRERLMGIIESCISRNDYKSALTAQEQLNKINGLYTQQVEVKADTTMKFNFGE